MSHLVYGLLLQQPKWIKTEIGTEKWRGCCNNYLNMWERLWKWVMRRGWKTLETHARKKTYKYHDWTMKGDSSKGTEGKDESSTEKASIFLENT